MNCANLTSSPTHQLKAIVIYAFLFVFFFSNKL